MAYQKKTWTDRKVEYPNRRIITDIDTGEEKTVTITRDEGEIQNPGDLLNAGNLNDLEDRIAEGIAAGGGTTVEVTQIQSTGTKIATITVDSVDTDLYAPQGGGSGGHTILDNEGISLTQRDDLQFKGAYSEDDSTDEKTVVNVARTMTLAEFAQLTDAEKVGFINVADETSGSDDKFQPVIYSEEEREIGVWTDGKPLYEKTVTKTINCNSEVEVVNSTDITNIDTIVGISGFLGVSPLSNYETSNYYTYADITGNKVICKCTWGSASTVPAIVTIRYTKTTDQAGSGQWTPQGVPAVHYSENEQVIGTWVDGSTLYEKTQYGGISITDADTWYDTSITGVDKAVMVSGTLLRSGEEVGLGTFNSRWIVRNNTVKISLSDLSGDTWSLMSITIRYTKLST